MLEIYEALHEQSRLRRMDRETLELESILAAAWEVDNAVVARMVRDGDFRRKKSFIAALDQFRRIVMARESEALKRVIPA